MILASVISFRLVLYCAISLWISSWLISDLRSPERRLSSITIAPVADAQQLSRHQHPQSNSNSNRNSFDRNSNYNRNRNSDYDIDDDSLLARELESLARSIVGSELALSSVLGTGSRGSISDSSSNLPARSQQPSSTSTAVSDNPHLNPNRTAAAPTALDTGAGAGTKPSDRNNNYAALENSNKDLVVSQVQPEVGKLFNVTQVLLTRFSQLFDNIGDDGNNSVDDTRNSNNDNNHEFDGGASAIEALIDSALSDTNYNDDHRLASFESNGPSQVRPTTNTNQLNNQQHINWPLETRKDGTRQSSGEVSNQNINNNRKSAAAAPSSEEDELNERHYFRVLNRVFSRVELPEPFVKTLSRANKANGSPSPGAPGLSRPQQCATHIGCIDELPNVPTIIKRSNVSASFVLYTRDTTDKPVSLSLALARKVSYEPLVHYQLLDSASSTAPDLNNAVESGYSSNEDNANNLAAAIAAEFAAGASSGGGVSQSNSEAAASIIPATSVPSDRISGAPISSSNNNNQRAQQFLWSAASAAAATAAAAAAAAAASTPPHMVVSMRQRQAMRRRTAGAIAHQIAAAASAAHSAHLAAAASSTSGAGSTSWRSAATSARVVASKELPFDMAALERCGFNGSLPTRIIVGGYFAKEDEEWIDELVKQWLSLEPSNVIKVNWADSNRGLYHRAAQNSRIVARQLSLFLHYLSHLFKVDLSRFHLVGHSLGAHIAGFVGADLDGKLARITGLDPAGPIFVELDGDTSMRLDPSDAKFVDVVHTNGGTITKGALGLANPSGHVDYYCNGGSLQPGCYFSSMTKSIMDPVERVACNHRRSYRYFTELIKMAAANKPLPNAYRFEVKSNEELTRLTRTPELAILSTAVQRRHSVPAQHTPPSGAPAKWLIEFHKIETQFPSNARGLYYFRTRPEQPFFSAKQCALTLRTMTPIRRRLSLLARLNNSLVLDLELDELSGTFTHLFVSPSETRLFANLAGVSTNNNNSTNDGGARSSATVSADKVPDLWLMWRQRSSFNLLPAVIGGNSAQSNELQLSTIELSLLESGGGGSDNNNSGSTDSSNDGDNGHKAASLVVIRYTMATSPFGPVAGVPDPMAIRADGSVMTTLARAASRRAALMDELQLALTGSSSHSSASEDPATMSPASSSSSSSTSPSMTATATATTTTMTNRLILARNHWHRFEAAKVERVVL